jgi:CRISPR-associated endoribonuclease Cas6
VGEAIEYVSYFILAFEELGKNGIGLEKSPFKIETVLCSGKSIYSPGEKKINRDFPLIFGSEFMEENVSVPAITIELETPLRIKFGRKFRKHFTFDMLARNLLRRIQLLSAFYCGGPLRVDFKELIEKSKEVKVSDSRIHWEQLTRFSFRQEKTVSMGGVSGSIQFSGDIGPFMPFLRIGEYLHVGKSTAFGLGKIKVTHPALAGHPLSRGDY